MTLIRKRLVPATKLEPWSSLRRSRRVGLLDFAAWNAFLVLQLLDLLTTVVGIELAGGWIVEANPVVAVAIDTVGVGALVSIAVAKLALFIVLYRALPRPFGLIVPVLAVLPTAIVVHSNVQILQYAYEVGVLL